MLRTEVKEALLLLIFSFFMYEVLTPVTVVAVCTGVLCMLVKYRPRRFARNFLALGVLVSYWLSYGRMIDPEVGLNFLTMVVTLKLLEKDSPRDQYMVFFGLILLISSGSLFEKGLIYTSFFACTFIFLIRDFYRFQGLSVSFKDLGILLLWILPLTFGLFALVPRLRHPVPFKGEVRGAGEIGYVSNVSFTSLEGLKANATPAFTAQVERELFQSELYWRGNTITHTDGWNWKMVPEDRPRRVVLDAPGALTEGALIRQSIRMAGHEEFLFSLDHPLSVSSRGEDFRLTDSKSVYQGRGHWIQRYEAISTRGTNPAAAGDVGPYLENGLSAEERAWINARFRGRSPGELGRELKAYFGQNGFSYSLSPGVVLSFKQFMQEKKTGFCSHYASAVALVMRTKSIPARLVSGFMGGDFNPFGGFYLVSQNDAHVWVEVISGGEWKRLDPTEWVAPDRVQLGGDAFMKRGRFGTFSPFQVNFAFLKEAKLWFNQWDFRFYQWIEQVDGGEAIFARMKFKSMWIYLCAPLLVLVFTAFYFWRLKCRRKVNELGESEELWRIFVEKSKEKGLKLPMGSVQEGMEYLQALDHPQKDEWLELWGLLVQQSFAGDAAHPGLRERIRRL